jgi:hypothetical protein
LNNWRSCLVFRILNFDSQPRSRLFWLVFFRYIQTNSTILAFIYIRKQYFLLNHSHFTLHDDTIMCLFITYIEEKHTKNYIMILSTSNIFWCCNRYIGRWVRHVYTVYFALCKVHLHYVSGTSFITVLSWSVVISLTCYLVNVYIIEKDENEPGILSLLVTKAMRKSGTDELQYHFSGFIQPPRVYREIKLNFFQALSSTSPQIHYSLSSYHILLDGT